MTRCCPHDQHQANILTSLTSLLPAHLVSAQGLAHAYLTSTQSILLAYLVSTQDLPPAYLYRILSRIKSTAAPKLGIKTLNGTNFSAWKDSLMLSLGLMEFDHALDKREHAEVTDKSTAQNIIKHEKWSRCNRMALVLMKNSISPIIRGAIPDSKDAKTYLAYVKDQFKGTSKVHAHTLILKLVTAKYDGISGIREHIMMMNDMSRKLKGLYMEISDGFLVHFIMTSLPKSFEAFKINYNIQKDKWTMSELIAMCVQEEERLKLDRSDVAYLMSADSKKRKGNFRKKETYKVQKQDANGASSSKNVTSQQ
ncbi:hypothetical protein L1987_39365 [Smallanthus sonchifolius]|uniref:Uncharacterized protein n=1 Tax=Smallanthus sonchifolius TaxID=185202 RepID=A0ACB9HMI3_9ASTR|nr:hypothetical protein L1987_39365 [Smallanthus sonchifolius]